MVSFLWEKESRKHVKSSAATRYCSMEHNNTTQQNGNLGQCAISLLRNFINSSTRYFDYRIRGWNWQICNWHVILQFDHNYYFGWLCAVVHSLQSVTWAFELIAGPRIFHCCESGREENAQTDVCNAMQSERYVHVCMRDVIRQVKWLLLWADERSKEKYITKCWD